MHAPQGERPTLPDTERPFSTLPFLHAPMRAERALRFLPLAWFYLLIAQNLEFSFSVRAKETRARFDGHARLENTLRTRPSDSPQEKYFSNGAPSFLPALARSLAADSSARESPVTV